MKPHSGDLRTRIVKALEEVMSKSRAARLFGVSHFSVKCFVKIADRGGSLRPRKGGGGPPTTVETTKKLLEEGSEGAPCGTASERHRFLEHTGGEVLSDSTV